MSILNPVGLVFLLYPLFLIGFFLGAPIIGFVYIRADADQSGQPGWLWALATVFLSWLAVLAYLIVRALSAGQPRTLQQRAASSRRCTYRAMCPILHLVK